jgi:hypothetical protein
MPIDCDEADDLRRQVRHDRQLHRALIAHPDPRDPDFPEDYMTTATTTTRLFPLKQWERQTPEEKFDAAMRDSRLVDEAAGFISDQDAAGLATLVAHTWRESGGHLTKADMAAIGLAYWTAITRAQRKLAGSAQ